MERAVTLFEATTAKHVEEALERGESIEKRDGSGRTPLLVACEEGREEVVESLINKGANVHALDSKGTSALLFACDKAKKKIIQMLLDNGVDPLIKNELGSTPFIWLCCGGTFSSFEDLVHNRPSSSIEERAQVFEILLSRGVSVHEPNSELTVPLAYAASNGHINLVNRLLELGVSIDFKDLNGSTALIDACTHGQWKTAEILIDHGADCLVKGEYERDAFLCAVNLDNKEDFWPFLKGNTSDDPQPADEVTIQFVEQWKAEMLVVLEKLIEKGADPNLMEEEGWNSFRTVCYDGNLFLAPFLIDHGADLHAPDPQDQFTPLHVVCQEGFSKFASFLIEKGANINAVDEPLLRTPLMIAIVNGHLETVKMLVASGADRSIVNSDGFNPLMAACSEGFLEIVEYLVSIGDELHFKSEKDGDTLLIESCRKGQHSVVLYLLEKGLDPHEKNTAGDTAFDVACREGSTDIVDHFLDVFEINIIQTKSPSCLSYACRKKRLDVIDRLMSAGFDINTEDRNGSPPIAGAAISGALEVIDRLIAAGADLSRQDSDGKTAVHWASRLGRVEALERLLSMGVDPNVPDNRGMTPLMLRPVRNGLEVAEILIKYGADPHIEDNEGRKASAHPLLPEVNDLLTSL